MQNSALSILSSLFCVTFNPRIFLSVQILIRNCFSDDTFPDIVGMLNKIPHRILPFLWSIQGCILLWYPKDPSISQIVHARLGRIIPVKTDRIHLHANGWERLYPLFEWKETLVTWTRNDPYASYGFPNECTRILCDQIDSCWELLILGFPTTLLLGSFSLYSSPIVLLISSIFYWMTLLLIRPVYLPPGQEALFLW